MEVFIILSETILMALLEPVCAQQRWEEKCEAFPAVLECVKGQEFCKRNTVPSTNNNPLQQCQLLLLGFFS